MPGKGASGPEGENILGWRQNISKATECVTELREWVLKSSYLG